MGARASVQEVFAVKARPMLWLPSTRPFQLHELDRGHNEVSDAEAVLQAILTHHQGKRKRSSLAPLQGRATVTGEGYVAMLKILIKSSSDVLKV